MIPTLETARLTLRPPRLEDFEPYAAFFASDRSICQDGPLNRTGVWKEFATVVGQWALRGYGAWSVEERASGAYVGEAGLFHAAHYPEAEIGWMVLADAEGKGIAHEAAIAVRAFAYGTLGLKTLVSYIDADNARSIPLADRLGATRDADAPLPEDARCLVYRPPGPEALQ